MAVKYECPKCNRKFTEWGAEKFSFKCPGDEWCPADRPKDIELVRVGAVETKSGKRPSLKRTPRRTAAPIPIPVEEEEDVMTEGFEVADEDVETEVMAGIGGDVPVAADFAGDEETPEVEDTGDAAIELDMPDDSFGDDAAIAPEDIAAEPDESQDDF